ncbi:energy transducer TonB [Dyella tabacisoli]|uniref:Energy transducer TonB n=1 Tax=Dyella tabacisoli TaxID=2282381 RepID=A0A369UHJ3_9GAMM|nr:energy transducer TonB [Dyella tabacisoli]RDD79803.1 energy transducer TonB [Dyella tabacisoli]
MWKQLFALALTAGLSTAVAQDAYKSETIANQLLSMDKQTANRAPPPSYPPIAATLNAEGMVVLMTLVGSDGRPKDIKVERSSGYRILDAAAINAVKDWIFSPSIKDGRPIEAYARIPVNFSATNRGKRPLTQQGKLAPILDGYMKQNGLIVDTDLFYPMPFDSAQQGLDALAKSSDTYRVEFDDPADGVIIYKADVTGGLSQAFEAFTEGSPFYPSVVRMRFVLKNDHLEIYRAILCGANGTACESLHRFLNQMDKKCGIAVPGCPGSKAVS